MLPKVPETDHVTSFLVLILVLYFFLKDKLRRLKKSKAFSPEPSVSVCRPAHPQSASGPSDASLQLSVNTCQGQVKRPAAFAPVFTAIVPLRDYVTGLNAA